jgi:hypothetical protein
LAPAGMTINSERMRASWRGALLDMDALLVV